MKFIVYETTNLINGRRYRGAHVCNHEICGYLGSGSLIKRAILKYGKDNFSRVILRECSSVEEMFSVEAEFVDDEWVSKPDTYNLKIGGEGGWDYINKNGIRWNEEKRRHHAIEMKKRRAAGLWGPVVPPMLGKTFEHSDAVKMKISANNGNKLSIEEHQKRFADIAASIYPKRGYIKQLTILWGVSHTQVRRYVTRVFEKR